MKPPLASSEAVRTDPPSDDGASFDADAADPVPITAPEKQALLLDDSERRLARLLGGDVAALLNWLDQQPVATPAVRAGYQAKLDTVARLCAKDNAASSSAAGAGDVERLVVAMATFGTGVAAELSLSSVTPEWLKPAIFGAWRGDTTHRLSGVGSPSI